MILFDFELGVDFLCLSSLVYSYVIAGDAFWGRLLCCTIRWTGSFRCLCLTSTPRRFLSNSSLLTVHFAKQRSHLLRLIAARAAWPSAVFGAVVFPTALAFCFSFAVLACSFSKPIHLSFATESEVTSHQSTQPHNRHT
jgi:hypothetical protein